MRWKGKASSGDHASSVADSILSCGGPGSTTADGHFDYSRCADDRTFRQCHSKACMGADWGQAHAEGKGRRRLEQADEEIDELRALSFAAWRALRPPRGVASANDVMWAFGTRSTESRLQRARELLLAQWGALEEEAAP